MSQLQPSSDYSAIGRLLASLALVAPWEEVESKLRPARSYVIRKDGEIALWVGYHGFTTDSCHMSVAIAPAWQVKVVTKGVIKEMLGLPFEKFGMENLRIGGSNPKNIASLLSLGLNLAYDSGDVILAKKEYERKFRMH